MNLKRSAAIALCIFSFHHAPAQDQTLDKALSDLSANLASQIRSNGMKKVTVLDLTDLQGGGSELGKYIAEELTVELVMKKRDFSVLDRANLRKILTEHKLTATGLIDPENAKKLGMFAGVDALVLGTIVPRGSDSINLTVKIITTETAEIIGAARAGFKSDGEVQKLLSQPAAVGAPSEKAQVVKSFGDLGVELNSLIVSNEREYTLDLVLKNQNAKKSIWVAVGINPNGTGTSKAVVRSPERVEFQTWAHLVSGIETCPLSHKGTFHKATEIKPGDTIPASIKFTGNGFGPALRGECTLQLELLLGYTMNRGYDSTATPHNLVARMKAE